MFYTRLTPKKCSWRASTRTLESILHVYAASLSEQVAVEDVEQRHGRSVEEQEVCGEQRRGGRGGR